jgi:hypothetical protein
MANPNPASDIATKLASIATFGAVTLVVDTNLFVGPERPVRTEVPELAVFCLNLPGPIAEPYCGIDEDFYRFQVEITVRSAPSEFQAGEDLARLVVEKLQRQPPSGYVSVLVQQSQPEYQGDDDNRIHGWTIVFECWWKG